MAAVNRGGGRREHVPDHDHPDLMSRLAHDQELHEQHTLPSDTRVYFDYDGGNTTGGAIWKTQFDPTGGLEVPDWVEEVNIYCVAVCEMPNPAATGDFQVRLAVDGVSSDGVSTHYVGDPSQCVVAFGRQITSPSSSLDITVATNTPASSGDTLIVQLTTSVVFERFAGKQGGGGLAG